MSLHGKRSSCDKILKTVFSRDNQYNLTTNQYFAILYAQKFSEQSSLPFLKAFFSRNCNTVNLGKPLSEKILLNKYNEFWRKRADSHLSKVINVDGI